MSYFMGKEGFVWWQGVVEDRHDPLYLGRCKVRILGWNTAEKSKQSTESLPWAYPVQPITSAAQTGVGTTPLGPVEGTWVLGFFRDGESAQEPMFFGTFGGIPEIDAKGENIQKGFFDPRQPDGDVGQSGHPMYQDEMGPRALNYNFTSKTANQAVPREPASIIHNADPDPTENLTDVVISEKVTLKQGAKPTEHPSHVKGEYSNFPVSQLIPAGSSGTPAFTVKVVENPVRSTFPDTGLAPLDTKIPGSLISTTRNLNYLKEPTTNRLARGTRGNSLFTDPLISGIVYEKAMNRLQGQVNVPCASGGTWSEPNPPWAALYPYNHVHQTESGHIVEMDDTPGQERLHWYHRTGTFTEIHNVGIKVDKIVNDYYNIILGNKNTHIELGECTTIDGDQSVYVKGSKTDRIGGAYTMTMGGGAFKLNNPGYGVDIFGYDLAIEGQDRLNLGATRFFRHSQKAHSHTVGRQRDVVGGLWKMSAGSMSFNTTGGASIQTGQGFSVNATDSITESIQGLLPSATLGFAKKTTATLGQIGIDSYDNALTGGIIMQLGLNGLGASISMKPLGDIDLTSNLGTTGITAAALLGDISFETVVGSIKEASLLSSFELTPDGAANMQGLLGEVSVSSAGKVKVKGLIISMKEALEEIIDIITEHTHPTGSGPSGPPMPPTPIKLNLLKSMKIAQSFE